MSIARVFNEMRPLFRMLEEPLTHNRRFGRQLSRQWFEDPFEDPFFRGSGAWSIRPSIDLKEDDSSFIVETDLPGVKKENLEVRIGDNGQSITIEGKINIRSQPEATATPTDTTAPAGEVAAPKENGNETSVVSHASERQFSSSSIFSRTVWLPRRVDESKVTAKLEDGVLTVRIPKAEDKESIKINVD